MSGSSGNGEQLLQLQEENKKLSDEVEILKAQQAEMQRDFAEKLQAQQAEMQRDFAEKLQVWLAKEEERRRAAHLEADTQTRADIERETTRNQASAGTTTATVTGQDVQASAAKVPVDMHVDAEDMPPQKKQQQEKRRPPQKVIVIHKKELSGAENGHKLGKMLGKNYEKQDTIPLKKLLTNLSQHLPRDKEVTIDFKESNESEDKDDKSEKTLKELQKRLQFHSQPRQDWKHQLLIKLKNKEQETREKFRAALNEAKQAEMQRDFAEKLQATAQTPATTKDLTLCGVSLIRSDYMALLRDDDYQEIQASYGSYIFIRHPEPDSGSFDCEVLTYGPDEAARTSSHEMLVKRLNERLAGKASPQAITTNKSSGSPTTAHSVQKQKVASKSSPMRPLQFDTPGRQAPTTTVATTTTTQADDERSVMLADLTAEVRTELVEHVKRQIVEHPRPKAGKPGRPKKAAKDGGQGSGAMVVTSELYPEGYGRDEARADLKSQSYHVTVADEIWKLATKK